MGKKAGGLVGYGEMIKILVGDCRERLKEIPSRAVQVCITSPPYFGLRDYSTEPLVWGGRGDCEHLWGEPQKRNLHTGSSASEKALSNRGAFHGNQETVDRFCHHCQAWRGDLGLEPTLEMYVDHLVEIFREARRVLRDDGGASVEPGG